MALLTPKIATARAVGTLARRAGRGGTSLPGKVLMRLEPDAIGRLGSRLEEGSVVISATNGKTTTAAMVSSVLRRHGMRPVHNRAGANMAGGIASTLLQAARRDGTIDGDLGLFEVDEFWLPAVADQLRPRALLLANLFRDQLDRYGELDTIAARWAGVVAAHADRAGLVLGADDPGVADLGHDRPGVIWFGVDDPSVALPELQHASDAKFCRNCGHPYAYAAAYMGHLGDWHCPNCGRRRPPLAVAAGRVELEGVHAARVELRTPAGTAVVELPLPGLYNVYNALAATALCIALDVPLATIVAGLESTEAAFGRAETVRIGGRELFILLVKNPAGANEVLRTLVLEKGEHDVLGVLNDDVADGRDVSWVWDADFEELAGRVRRVTCAGTRAGELAVRLKYAGLDPARIRVVPGLPSALDAATGDGTGPLFVLPTYTAMLGLQDLFAERGISGRYWE